MNRAEALVKLRETVASGGVIVGAGAGTGLSAKCAEAGGVDLIIIYNSGRYRMAGRGSLAGLLPYGDANTIVVEMAGEVLPIVKHTPVLAGVCGTDPFRLMPYFLKQIKEMGFAGVFVTLLLYTALLLRMIQNAQRAKDRAGMFLVMGVAAMVGFHVLVNVAMVIGYMPVTGIPLPLMSYGGSAMLFVFLALGLVMNVRLRRFVN